ncbi:MAG: hypothetical protein QGH25_24480, partial [Candidatus Latescibacteria bacterium]|nr:hypothetical protein [Candidatus Latescibacterota bacterium]
RDRRWLGLRRKRGRRWLGLRREDSKFENGNRAMQFDDDDNPFLFPSKGSGVSQGRLCTV